MLFVIKIVSPRNKKPQSFESIVNFIDYYFASFLVEPRE